jgi:hypothetical protein
VTGSPPVTLSIRLSGTNAVVTWPTGVLLQTPTLFGPWTTNTAISPCSVPIIGNQFFRVLVNP